MPRTSPLKVPELGGLTPEEAVRVLEALRLRSGEVVYQPENKGRTSHGLVLRTNPPAGTEVDAGATIQMVVSGTTQWTSVPDVVEKSLAKAISALKGPGGSVDHVVHELSTDKPPGEVIDQVPEPESRVRAGSKIVLYVSQGPVPSEPVGEDDTPTGPASQEKRRVRGPRPNWSVDASE